MFDLRLHLLLYDDNVYVLLTLIKFVDFINIFGFMMSIRDDFYISFRLFCSPSKTNNVLRFYFLFFNGHLKF